MCWAQRAKFTAQVNGAGQANTPRTPRMLRACATELMPKSYISITASSKSSSVDYRIHGYSVLLTSPKSFSVICSKVPAWTNDAVPRVVSW